MIGRRKQLIGFLVLTALVIASVATVVRLGGDAASGPEAPLQATSDVVIQAAESPEEPAPTTILGAWDAISEYAAQEWGANPQIVRLTSIDHVADGESARIDGHRRAWHAVVLSTERPAESLQITFHDGAVIEATIGRASGDDSPLDRPAVDSPQASEAARQAAQLDPPNQPAGNHFALVRTEHNSAAVTVVRVSGSIRGFRASVDIHGRTCAVVAREVHGFGDTGGLLVSDDAGRTWTATDLRGMVTAVTNRPNAPQVAYAVEAHRDGIVLHRSVDAGRSWTAVSTLPLEAGMWPFAVAALPSDGEVSSLAVGTERGLWVSSDGGHEWSTPDGLPRGRTTDVVATRFGHVLVSLSSSRRAPLGSSPRFALYSSSDFEQWDIEAERLFALSVTPDGDGVVAVDTTDGTMLLLDFTAGLRPSVIELPVVAGDSQPLRAAGTLEGRVLAQSPQQIRLSEDGGQTWTTTFDGSFASLALSPSVGEDGVALAGGFRTGIYRTEDFGRTWDHVLQDPSDVVPGSNVMSSVVFLGSEQVVAINFGEFNSDDLLLIE